MTLTISADSEKKYFEVYTKDERFANAPMAGAGRGYRTFYVPIYKKSWFEQLEEIASWVNNELHEECLFEIF